MNIIRSGRFSAFAVATVTVLVIACIFSIFGMSFIKADALTQEELQRKYDFSVEMETYDSLGVSTGAYTSGVATDLYNMPFFTLQLTKIFNGAFVGDNRDIRFYFAFSDTLVNPLTSINAESWVKLLAPSDVIEEGGQVQYNDIDGVATIDFSLEQVLNGYVDNFIFHQFVFFKVVNTAIDEDPNPEVVRHQSYISESWVEVLIDMTSDEIREKYDFTINTNDYMSGITTYGATEFPEFFIQLKDASIMNYADFSYAIHESYVANPKTSSELTWLSSADPASGISSDINDYGWNVDLLEQILSEPQNVFHRYMYFKVLSLGLEVTEEYVSSTWIEVIVDKTGSSSDYDIVSVSASYNDGSTERSYPITNAPSQTWVSSGVKVEVRTKAETNAEVFYALVGGDEQPFEYNDITKSYTATILGSESDIMSYSGRITLKTYDGSMQTSRLYSGDLKVYIDKVEPIFDVEAKKADESDYLTGQWSSSRVRYIITPEANIELKSGARYQYLDTNGWTDLNEVGGSGVFVYEATESMNLSFRSVSGSGIIYNGGDFVAQIDTVAPVLLLSAKDGKEKEILTMGAPEGPNQRAGYAQNRIIFTLNNTAIQSDPRNPIYFEYKTDPDSLVYLPIPASGSNYVLENTATATVPIVNRTYYLRIRTGAGLVSAKQFTVTVLRENFAVNMELQPYYPNASLVSGDSRLWVSEKVKVDFLLPVFLNQPNEYEINGYITGNTATTEILPYTRSEISGGKATFTVEINKDIDGTTMSFYVYDKAKNKVENATGGLPLRTPILNLDLKQPNASVTATISGTATELGPSDWSAGEVVITIIPQENISNTVCYRMINENQQSTIQIPKIGNSSFEISVTNTGIYRYVLKSGAGLLRYITVPVNIDTTEIVFTDVAADLIGTSGNIMSPNIDLTGNTPIASDIKVRFLTNHTGHFRYFYAPFTSEVNPFASPNAYLLGTGEEFIINMPTEGGKGEFKYIFYLESTVQNRTGTIQRTETKYVIFRYDVRNYSIEISAATGNDWLGEPIDFSLDISQASQYETDPIVVTKYQYRLNGGVSSGLWMDIDSAVELDGHANFLFGGIKWFYNQLEALDDAATAGNPDEFARRKYSSYNGYITFRAINLAGHPSTPIDVQVKVDTSTPNVVYAVSQMTGEVVWDGGGNLYHIYSTGAISLRSTDAIVDPNSIFKQKAPISYYYRVTTQSESVPPAIASAGWTKLTGTQVLTEAYYWVYAKNDLMINDNIVAHKIHVFRETVVLGAEIISGGTIGASGAYEFNWTDRATVRIRPTSQTGVYYWYKIDNEPWVRYNSLASPYNRDGEIRFLGGADALFPEALVRNFKGTVRFKITNLAGAEKVLERAVIIKIDVDTPHLGPDNIHLSTTEITSISIEDARDRWYPSAILVEISGNDGIPSGVIYQYKLEGTEEYQFMRTNRISTDDIIAANPGINFADGNGTVSIILQAKSKATQSYQTYNLKFNIDKIIPDFRLIGQAMTESVAGRRITSGQWTNATEVVISREVIKAPASQVSYYYYDYNTPEIIIPWLGNSTLSFTLISRKIVVAETQAGLKVQKEFQINIDSVKPLIHSGIIVNSNDPLVPNVYYIDQVVTFTEDNLDYANYNNFPLSNGQIIATNTVDNSNGGYVHIVIADKAGNKAELKFYMTIFPLSVSGEGTSIELNEEHMALLSTFENHYQAAVATNALSSSRSEYFRTTIARLWDRVHTLEKQVADYRAYLVTINQRPTFELVSDYPDMKRYVDYFTSLDPLVRYPEWQQNKIREGTYATYYEKLLAEYAKLNALMEQVRKLEKQTISLPAMNIAEKGDYENVIRVFSAYLGLSTDQKAVYNPNLFTKLKELKRICEVYLLQDKSSGISIYGDSLVGEEVSVSVEVIPYAKTTEIFNEAQKTLLATMPSTASRAIISMNKVGLTGWGSQYDTGTIAVTLPIPEEFYNYTTFVVYRLYSDGTMAPMDNVVINMDGKSVTFPADRLDTYVLATTANITVREEADTVYGSVMGIDISRGMLIYIAYGGAAILAIMLIIIALMVIKKKKFLRNYDRAHKDNLVKRGIDAIPKGNPPPPSNPARPEERVATSRKIKYLK